eukprot:2059982-Rhodomonas_salina.1
MTQLIAAEKGKQLTEAAQTAVYAAIHYSPTSPSYSPMSPSYKPSSAMAMEANLDLDSYEPMVMEAEKEVAPRRGGRTKQTPRESTGGRAPALVGKGRADGAGSGDRGEKRMKREQSLIKLSAPMPSDPSLTELLYKQSSGSMAPREAAGLAAKRHQHPTDGDTRMGTGHAGRQGEPAKGDANAGGLRDKSEGSALAGSAGTTEMDGIDYIQVRYPTCFFWRMQPPRLFQTSLLISMGTDSASPGGERRDCEWNVGAGASGAGPEAEGGGCRECGAPDHHQGWRDVEKAVDAVAAVGGGGGARAGGRGAAGREAPRLRAPRRAHALRRARHPRGQSAR